MPSIRISEIAAATGLSMVGEGDVRVARVAPPRLAGPDDLAVALAPSYASDLKTTEATAALIWDEAAFADSHLRAALVAVRPRVALAGVTRLFQPTEAANTGVHELAHVDPSAEVSPGAVVGPFVTVGANARIGEGVHLVANVTIGAEAAIGAGTVVRPGTRIGSRCTLGKNVLIHENAVIGADGFSFEPPERGSVEAVRSDGEISSTNSRGFLRIHSLAAVTIGDDVEIGAGTTIDRGTLVDTSVGQGTKIDNQVQLGHNVQVGENCLLCAQVGIAGSTKVGDRVVLGGKVGVADHVEIGSDTICAAGALIPSRVPPQSIMMGAPAVSREVARRQFAAIRRLPRMVEQLAQVRKTLGL